MFAVLGVVFTLAGGVTIAVSTTMFGQISALILWLIAAVFFVGHDIIRTIEREARGLGTALAMHAQATPKSPAQPAAAPPQPPMATGKKTLWQHLKGQ